MKENCGDLAELNAMISCLSSSETNSQYSSWHIKKGLFIKCATPNNSIDKQRNNKNTNTFFRFHFLKAKMGITDAIMTAMPI